MKTNRQFSALRKGALDISLDPLSYAGGEVRRDQHRPDAGAGAVLRAGRSLEDAEVGKKFSRRSSTTRASSS